MKRVDGRMKTYAGRYLLPVLIVLIGAGCMAGSASAAIGPELVEFGEEGSGAGQILFPRAIAADPETGHLFITDAQNNRISEFTAWGEFVKVWGWGVADGGEELQTCTAADATAEHECRAGIDGDAAGQLTRPGGIAVAENGDVYVREEENRRVQVFSPEGDFLRMFGGDVNKTLGAPNPDVCTVAELEAGGECGAGVEGTGPSEFSDVALGGSTFLDHLDIVSGTVYVGDRDRIQEFELDGTFKTEIPLPSPGEPGGLWVDRASGDIYFVYGADQVIEPVQALRLSPAGAFVNELPEKEAGEDGTWTPSAVTGDPEGNVFLAQGPAVGPNDGGYVHPGVTPRVLEINPSGEIVDSCCSLPIEPGSGNGVSISAVTTNVVTAAGNADLYIVKTTPEGPSVEVRGPAPDKWPAPSVQPRLEDQFASAVSVESAVLKAEINPEFWGDTRYFLEYGEADCSGGGCTQVPASPGKLLGAGIVKRSVTTDGTLLSGLKPGTIYHYRFIAQSGGGGPVYGPDETFTTFPLPAQPQGGCPNAAFRIGAAATLSDCRAYELVSPVDKNGGELDVPNNILVFPARLEQSAASGEAVTYSAAGSFAGAPSGPYVSQYLAGRGAGGWSTQAITPPRVNGSLMGANGLDASFQAFLPDLSSGWVRQDSDLQLTADAQPGIPDLYRRDNADGSYAALTTAPPLARAEILEPRVEGFSADGKRAVFAIDAKLTANASGAAGLQLYEAFEGTVKLVSLKPNGSPALGATVGSVSGVQGSGLGRATNLTTAMSESGDRIYWSAGSPDPSLYVRTNGTKTVEVAPEATFWSATPDGSTALYSQSDGALKLFDLATKSSTQIAGGVDGVLGASEDLSRVYFVSGTELATGAQAKKPNLYLYEAGSPIRFLATLSSADLNPGGNAFSPVSLAPWQHVARVTADGKVAVFMSTASLTGAANVDQQSGFRDAEVFRYDAVADQLRCLSCSPTGARPSGGQQGGVNLAPLLGSKSPVYWFASRIPGWELNFHAPRALSGDGTRVFFDSTNRLTLADTNGREDVYQWEQEGSGECSQSAPGFDAKTGGCVTMISSGQGSARSEFIDASKDGRDVFFLTATSLLPQDRAQTDLYDARVGGGFPQPPAPPAACEGEACQGPPSPPADGVPASSTYRGAGNVREGARRCPRGKRKFRRGGKTVCVRHGKKADHRKTRRHHSKPRGFK